MQALSRRRILGAAGAFAGGSILAAPSSATESAATAPDPVIALIAEEGRLRSIGDAYDEQVQKLVRAHPDHVRRALYSQLERSNSLPEPMGSLYRESVLWLDAAEDLATQIETTTPKSIEGAAAMLEWANADSGLIENVVIGLQEIAKRRART